MSMYQRDTENSTDVLLSERNIYGSDRVGQEQVTQVMAYESEIGLGVVDFSSLTIDNTNSGFCSTGGVLAIMELASPAYVFDYSISDHDGDGNTDLLVNNNPTPSTDPDLINADGYTSLYTAQLMINTIPGESYPRSCEIPSRSRGIDYSWITYLFHEQVIEVLYQKYSPYLIYRR